MDWVAGVVNAVLSDTQVHASNAGGFLTNPGDSGGPFYTLNASTNRLVLRGILYGTVSGSFISDSIYSNVYEHLGWTRQQTHQSTFLADVTGDGRADGVAVNPGDIWVAASNGSTLATPRRWLGGGFFGDRGVFFADVNRDGRADGVAVNGDSVWVTLSQRPDSGFYGTSFSAPQRWRSGAFSGELGVLVGDVNNDQRAVLVAVNPFSVWVSLSGGTSFGPAQQ